MQFSRAVHEAPQKAQTLPNFSNLAAFPLPLLRVCSLSPRSLPLAPHEARGLSQSFLLSVTWKHNVGDKLTPSHQILHSRVMELLTFFSPPPSFPISLPPRVSSRCDLSGVPRHALHSSFSSSSPLSHPHPILPPFHSRHSVSSSELMRKQRLLKAELARLPGVKFYCGDYRVSGRL